MDWLRQPKRWAVAAALLLLAGIALVWWMVGEEELARVDAPPPLSTDSDPDVPPIPLARLAAPIEYDLESILVDLEDAVPSTFGDLEERVDHSENDRVQVAYRVERSPFEASMRGDTAHLAATLTYSGRAWFDPPLLPAVSASCGFDDDQAPPRARIALSSPLRVDVDWVLRSQARVDLVEAESEEDRDRCRITPLGIDVTGTALAAVRNAIEGHTEEIDREVAGVDLRSRLQGVWNTLEEPVELTEDVWLLVRPEGVTQGTVSGEGTTLTIQVGMTARPLIHLGPPPDTVFTDLPPLEMGAVADAASIHLEARLHYPESGRLLMREMEDREVALSGGLVRVRDIAFQGIGDGRLAVRVMFEGTAQGTIFLVGRPELDLGRGEVHVPDLDFDVETRNLLVGGMAWLAHEQLVSFLRDRARIPAERIMDAARDQLLDGLNRDLSDEVRVEGEVLSTRLIEVITLREALVVHAEADVRAVLRVASGRTVEGEVNP